MVKDSFLLNLLQFVALVAPALAILMQVVLTIEDDRNLDVGPFSVDELRILQLSLVIVLSGGVIIGSKLIASIDDLTVVLGMSLIFGGLPFSAIAVLLMANKSAYTGASGSESLAEQVRRNLSNASSVLLSAGFPAVVYFLLYDHSKAWVDELLNFGFFYQGEITPSMFLAVGFAIMTATSLLTLSRYDIENLKTALNLGVRNSLYLPMFLVVFGGPFYLIAYLSVNYSIGGLSVSKANPLLNVTHIWVGVLFYAIFSHDYDPLQED
jgi:hypothetical protein